MLRRMEGAHHELPLHEQLHVLLPYLPLTDPPGLPSRSHSVERATTLKVERCGGSALASASVCLPPHPEPDGDAEANALFEFCAGQPDAPVPSQVLRSLVTEDHERRSNKVSDFLAGNALVALGVDGSGEELVLHAEGEHMDMLCLRRAVTGSAGLVSTQLPAGPQRHL